jgi:NADPH:quinone reductase-like Zn-dependent oxidoreductase
VARKRIKPVVERAYRLEEAALAHGMVEAGLATGRLLLKPAL